MDLLKLLPSAGHSVEDLEQLAQIWCTVSKYGNWAIGDIACLAERKGEHVLNQVFPPGFSVGQIQRCKKVSEAYPPADRNSDLTWTQHMQLANDPDRKAKLMAIAQEGLTSDESRKKKLVKGKEAKYPGSSREGSSRWLLAFDVNYHIHRHWHSGAGVEAASQVAEWVERLVDRLRDKGLTDVVCCFDSTAGNFRKELTKEWDRKYKDRGKKDAELESQIELVGDLLHKKGFCCASSHLMEADDCIASYASQFDGMVTIVSQDKDLNQCLGSSTNMLLDTEWEEEEHSGQVMPSYKWRTAASVLEDTGIESGQWADFQAIWGDNTDGVQGAPGIGEKGAAALIREFGDLDAILAAAKDGDERIKPKKIDSLLALAQVVDVTRQLVTMRTDLDLPSDTLLAARE